MKKILFIASIMISVSSFSQSKIDTTMNYFFKNGTYVYSAKNYPPKDTVKCVFMEVFSDVIIRWRSGYVARENGFVSFAPNVRASPEYLPSIAGVVKSQLFYNDMTPVINKAVQVVLMDY